TIAGWRIDYSDVQLPDLNEFSCTDETVGLHDTVHPTDITYALGRFLPVLGPVDWNGDGDTTDTCIANHDLNQDFSLGILHGVDDWAWIHARLTAPSISNIVVDPNPGNVPVVHINGVNLMQPATVIFARGATVIAQSVDSFSLNFGTPNTRLTVPVPAGAKNGPITVITPEGKATSSQSVTITP